MTTTPTLWLAEQQANTSDSGPGGDDQLGQQIVGLANGNFMVLWEDNSDIVDGSNGTDIIGQLYSAEGVAIGAEFQANSGFFLDDEGDFTAAALPNGNFVIAYEDTDVNGTSIRYDIRTEAGGFVAFGTIQADPGVDILGTPSITASSDGSFLVAYQSRDQDASAGLSTFGVVVSSAGVAGTPVLLLSDNQTDDSSVLEVDTATLTNGNYVIVSRDPGADPALLMRIMTPALGNVLGFTQVADTATNGDTDTDPTVTALSDGRFVVAWTNTDANDTDLQFQIYTAAGATVGGVGAIRSGGATDNNNEAELIGLSDGGFVVAWDDDETNEIKLQRYNSTGGLVGTEVTVTGSDTETAPTVTLSDDGRLLVGWTNNQDVEFAIYDSRDSVIAGDGTAEVITSRQDGADVSGNGGNDTLLGEGANDTLRGGDDNDSILGRAGDDLLEGGFDADTILGGFGNDAIFANSQENPTGSGFGDSLFGEEGNDTIVGSSGGDTIDGGTENDTVNGGGGADSINGDAGNDLLQGGFDGDTINGGADNDTIFAMTQADPTGSGAGDILNGDDGADTITGANGADTIDGGSGSDSVIAGDGDDLISDSGFPADFDIVDAGNGNDTVNGGGGFSSIDGGAGNDLLEGGFNADTINGGADNDTIFAMTQADPGGSSSGDLLNGDDGADTITGSASGDSLDGGTGADSVQGGDGSDTVRDGDGFSGDTLRGGLGIDTLDYGPVKLGAGVVIDLQAGLASKGAASEIIAGFENVIGSRSGEAILGSAQSNRLNGGNGADSIDGRNGLDTLQGGKGDDTLAGGRGRDSLDGGVGADRFDFNAAAESGLGKAQADVIADFSTAQDDRIDLADLIAGSFAFIGAAAFSGANEEVRVINISGGRQLVQVDADGDGASDMDILVRNGGLAGGAADFVL